MTEKQLRKLKRVELLELLVEQSVEMDQLREELEAARRELAERKIAAERSGSLAEAALKLSGVFEAADQAARDYLENVRRMCAEERAE